MLAGRCCLFRREEAAVQAMMDASQSDPKLSSPEAEIPDLPAPWGRTFVLLSLAVLSSVGLCCVFRHKGAPPETGTLAGQPTRMVSHWTGRIRRLLVEAGDAVEAGQPLAILVNEHLLLQIDRQQREVDELRQALLRAEQTADAKWTRDLKALDAEILQLKSAQATANRLRGLEVRRLELGHQIREAAGLPEIREALIQAEAELRRLKVRPIEQMLPSPVTGTVGKLLRKPGDRVVAGTPLLELSDQDHPLLIVELPEPVAKRFALGDTIPLRFPGQAESIGRVADMQRLEPRFVRTARANDGAKTEARVQMKIEPLDGNWPALPLKSPVKVRTSDSQAMSRRVN